MVLIRLFKTLKGRAARTHDKPWMKKQIKIAKCVSLKYLEISTITGNFVTGGDYNNAECLLDCTSGCSFVVFSV